MVFSIVIILLFLLVTYFSYVQGAFTALISAACAIFAMLIAFGYYESLASRFTPGSMADFMPAACLMILFAVAYIVLRIAADSIAPGNVSLQLYVEKTVAVLFSALAAAVAVGVFATAAQIMPFGPTVGDYSRYDIRTRTTITVPKELLANSRSDIDTDIRDELAEPTLAELKATPMLLPIDDMVIGITKAASGGSLAGSQDFATIHPDFLGQAALNRSGGTLGNKRLAINGGGVESAKVTGVFTVSKPSLLDTDLADFREGKKPHSVKLLPNQSLLVTRVVFGKAAADSDSYVRVPLGGVRLNINGVNYHPIGTLDASGNVGIGRLDDLAPVLLQGEVKAADFVFAVETTTLTSAAPAGKFKANAAFVDVRLFARTDLVGQVVTPWKADPTVQVLRKKKAPIGGTVPEAAAPKAS